MTEPLIVQPGEGRLLDLGNFEAVVLASADQTGNLFSLLLTRSEPEGFGPPLHRHHDAAEAFFVLAGEYLMQVAGREERCPPGTFVYVPRDVPHTFRVVSKSPGSKLNVFAPAAMVGFFEELAQAEATGEATPQILDAIASRHHMDMLGPAPDSYL